jgi:hypothetical protein
MDVLAALDNPLRPRLSAMSQVCLRYVSGMSQVCLRYVSGMSQARSVTHVSELDSEIMVGN